MSVEPYSGYRQRKSGVPDPELTRVGPDTPCGEWLRRLAAFGKAVAAALLAETGTPAARRAAIAAAIDRLAAPATAAPPSAS